MNDGLGRIAKAIHTLFYADERAHERYVALESSLVTDDDLGAFQALSIGLINFDPLPPEVLEGLRTKVAEIEEREANPPTASPRIRVEPGSGGDEAAYFKRLLDGMYARWDGTLDYERGVHRLCVYSQFDDQCRRHTSFAHVYVDGECPDVHVRNYVLGPYLRVADERTKRQSDDPWRVLGGDLTPILPEEIA